MDTFKRTLALCGAVAALCLGSCVTLSDDELDLDKKLSLDMQIGRNGLTIPVGNLSKIYLDSLIKVGGDNSALDTLDGGLFGFTMEDSIKKVKIDIDEVKIDIPAPEIDPISTKFDAPSKEDLTLDIPDDSTTTVLEISSINLSGINDKLPKFNIPVHAEAPVNIPVKDYVISKEMGVIPVPTQNQDITFSYKLPDDVLQLNKVYFGEAGTSDGQKVSLNVDLGGIYNIMTNPDITINSLSIQFPDNFVLGKDSNLDSYFSAGTVQVNGNSFSISNADIKTISGTSKILPITFFIKSADFSTYGTDIDYSGSISYGLTLAVGGTTNQAGKLYVDVNLNSDLQMADFSVNTAEKTVTLDPDSISSSCVVKGLDGMKSINSITFVESESCFRIKLSDFNINPFSFGADSKISLVFSNDFTFDKSYSLNGCGTWTTQGSNNNVLEIDPAQAKGKEIVLHLSGLTLNQDVDQLNATITLNNDVAYSASIKILAQDNLHASDIENLGNKEIKFKVSGHLEIFNADFVTNEITTDLADTTKISIDEDVDEAVLSLSRVIFAKSAAVNMNLKFAGVPNGINQMRLSNFTIKFPEYLKISYSGDPNIKVDADGRSLVVNKVLTETELSSTGNGFTISGLMIDSLEFAKPKVLENGKLVLKDQEVQISGKAIVAESSISLGDVDDIVVTPTVTFEQIEVQSVVGKVNPKIDPIKESVKLSLGSDVDFLKDASLKLSDPKININLKSSVTVPINLDLSLSSKKEDGTPIGQNITPDNGIIRIEPCHPDSATQTTKLVIGQSVKDSVAGNTIFVAMSNLSKLMTSVPDSIMFNINATVDTTVWHSVDIKRELAVSGNYDVSIPLSFDSLFVNYSDTIKDLGKDLKDIADKVVGSVRIELNADSIVSSIPLGVNLKVEALDENKNAISEISVDSCLIGAGSDEGRLLNPLTLVLNVKEGGLKKLDMLKFTARCSSDDNNTGTSSIKKGQYLLVRGIKLKLPQGVIIDLTETSNKK